MTEYLHFYSTDTIYSLFIRYFFKIHILVNWKHFYLLYLFASSIMDEKSNILNSIQFLHGIVSSNVNKSKTNYSHYYYRYMLFLDESRDWIQTMHQVHLQPNFVIYQIYLRQQYEFYLPFWTHIWFIVFTPLFFIKDYDLSKKFTHFIIHVYCNIN